MIETNFSFTDDNGQNTTYRKTYTNDLFNDDLGINEDDFLIDEFVSFFSDAVGYNYDKAREVIKEHFKE